MNKRERFAACMAHQQPDRAPRDFAGTSLTACMPEFLQAMCRHLGIQADGVYDAEDQIGKRLDTDFRRVGAIFEPPTSHNDTSRLAQGEYTDCWGIVRHQAGFYWDIWKSPLRDMSLEDLQAYEWPDAANIDKKQLDDMEERAKRLYYDTDVVVVGEHPVLGYLELGCWMFGFDDFLYRLLGEPETAQWFFSNYHRYVTDVCELYYGRLGKYFHVTTSGDDFGTQKGPFISPELFREAIAPWYKKRIAMTREMTDAYYFHHSCGSVFRLIPDILDMGVDILNPIQPGAVEMEPERLKDAYGDRLTYWGGIDEQNLLTKGTPEEVKKETARVLNIMNRDGGYVLAASHNIQPDVPPENVVAMFSVD